MVHKIFNDDESRSRSRDNSRITEGRNLSAEQPSIINKKPAEELKSLDMTIDEIIDSSAFIWCCGKNTEGELGLGHEDRVCLPQNVEQLRDFQIRALTTSNSHTVLMTPGGDIHVAGSSLHGKLGIEKINKKQLNKFHVVT